MNRKICFQRFIAGLLALCAVGLVGCQSAQSPGGKSHAAVRIPGHSLAELQQTTTAVFREAGYALKLSLPAEMVFERPGSGMDAAKWGGWSGQGVTMRVKVRVTETIEGGHLLQADAYAVQNSADPFFQTETRNMLLNSHPYKKLLNQVADRLK